MKNGETKIPIKGVHWREISKGEVNVGDELHFVRETKNPYDDKAVRIMKGEMHLGYMEAGLAKVISNHELVELNKKHIATITHIGYEDGMVSSIDVVIGRR